MTEFKLKTASELSADEQANLLAGESAAGCSCGNCTGTCTCSCNDTQPSSSLNSKTSSIVKEIASGTLYSTSDAKK